MRGSLITLLLGGLISLPASAYAQEKFYRVYSWDLPFEGALEAELWSTYITRSSLTTPFHSASVSSDGFWAHSTELEYGITPAWSVAGYIDFAQPRDRSFQVAGARLETRYRFDRRGDHFFDTALYGEYGVPRAGFLGPEGIELRLILEKWVEDFGVRLNPTIFKPTAGPEVTEGIELGYAAGVYYRRYTAFQPGVEIYGSFGPLSAIPPLSQTSHKIFVVSDLRFGSAVSWQLGAGAGYTPGSDRLTFKSLITIEPQPSVKME